MGGILMNKKKLRYAILKEVDGGNKVLTEKYFNVEVEDFNDAVRFLSREGYIKGLVSGDNQLAFFEGTAYATEKGEDCLSENNTFAKSYNGLKEIRDWLKL